MSALALIAIAVAWSLCSVHSARFLIRGWHYDVGIEHWGELAFVVLCSVFFGVVGGPVIVAWQLFEGTIGQRVKPWDVADALAGKPRQTPEQRIRELEARNAKLERELGIR